MKLQERSASLPAPAQPIVTFEPQPTAEESNHILQQAINYVHRYTATLVDFTCTVTTRTYTKEQSESRPLSDTSIVIADATSYISTKQYKALFRKSFAQYRKFEAESKILGITVGH